MNNNITNDKLKKLTEEVSNLNPTDFCKVMHSFTRDIINRLQAENEKKDELCIELLKTSSERAEIISEQNIEINRLKEENKILDLNRRMALLEKESLYDKIKTSKAEAYKECIEKVKEIAIKKKIVYVADASLQEQETGWLEIQEMALDNLLKKIGG